MMLCMHVVRYSTIDELQTWISRSNWPVFISKVKRDYLGIFTVQYIRDKASTKTTTTVSSISDIKKIEWQKSDGHQQIAPNLIAVKKGLFEEIGPKPAILFKKTPYRFPAMACYTLISQPHVKKAIPVM